MAKQRKQQNPKSRLLYRKYIVDGKFDPYNPSEELETELYEWVTPASSYIKKDCRDISLGRMDYELASYIAFEAVMGKPEIRLLAAMKYYIEFAKDVEVSKQDMYTEITNTNECGIISTIHAQHLKEKWRIE